ncbi:MAG: hypothetical protein J5554_07425 [Paludibacteraceae bacterium]|nr:hypothetical protein [Paludibacteraceae bacterium]
MKTKFIKIATIVALGAVCFLSSCDKEELQENDLNTSTVNIKDSNNEFDEFIEELSKDTNAIVASISAKKINSEKLRSVRSLEHRFYNYECIVDVLVAGNKGEAFSKNGYIYHKLDVDLNMGAGGAYQYLYVAYDSDWGDSPNRGVVDIYGYYNRNCNGWSNMVMDDTYGGIANVNRGTKGGSINLQMKKAAMPGSSDAITDIAVVAYKHAANNTITSMVSLGSFITMTKSASKLDLNKGAGGRYIYIFCYSAPRY